MGRGGTTRSRAPWQRTEERTAPDPAPFHSTRSSGRLGFHQNSVRRAISELTVAGEGVAQDLAEAVKWGSPPRRQGPIRPHGYHCLPTTAWGADDRRRTPGAGQNVAEVHAGLSEVAFKLRRELTPKGPALKAAIKAEHETLHLKRELGRLDIEDPEPAGESDRRGPATAAEGFNTMSREHVSRSRDEPPGVPSPTSRCARA